MCTSFYCTIYLIKLLVHARKVCRDYKNILIIILNSIIPIEIINLSLCVKACVNFASNNFFQLLKNKTGIFQVFERK